MNTYFDSTQHEYFKGHKDSVVINKYLNSIPKDSADFQVVYQLRKIGEEFVDGRLSMSELKDESLKLIEASSEAEAFIRQMKCYTFYSAICHIGQGQLLSPFEMKMKQEIEHPSWKGEANSFSLKLSRWWHTRWKHPLVFNEPPFARVVTWIWSVVRMQNVVKD